MNSTLNDLLNKAFDYYRERNLASALELYSQVLELDRNNPIALCYKGGILNENGSHKEALYYLLQAPIHLMEPKSKAIMYRRIASSYAELNEYNLAIKNYAMMFHASAGFMQEIAEKYVDDAKNSNPARIDPPAAENHDALDPHSVFSTIYKQNLWGDGSGGGSNLDKAAIYVAYIQYLVDTYKPSRILDIGCGDWRFSQYIDFGASNYIGIDVVSSVIQDNTIRFGSEKKTFIKSDATADPLPPADMIICKDVVQHLSDDLAVLLIDKCRNSKIFLLTNDYSPVNLKGELGGNRPLNPVAPPFDLDAKPVLYFSGKVTFLSMNLR